MKICIVGAGAIGGYLGAKLALAGEEVTLIARGSHLEEIQTNGLKLLMADGSFQIATPSLATSDIQAADTRCSNFNCQGSQCSCDRTFSPCTL